MYTKMYSLDDESLRKNLDERRHVAEEREAHLREANDLFDDDSIMERIFNSLTGTCSSNVYISSCS